LPGGCSFRDRCAQAQESCAGRHIWNNEVTGAKVLEMLKDGWRRVPGESVATRRRSMTEPVLRVQDLAFISAAKRGACCGGRARCGRRHQFDLNWARPWYRGNPVRQVHLASDSWPAEPESRACAVDGRGLTRQARPCGGSAGTADRFRTGRPLNGRMTAGIAEPLWTFYPQRKPAGRGTHLP
jgi:hypothetical protein